MSNYPYKIYNASAGSGKTHTLTREYLKIILSSPHSFGQILAITFTNKAVNEMKQRILNSLYEFSTQKKTETPSPLFVNLMNDLKIDQQSLKLKAKKTLKDILHNYGFFDISTIDKFTHRIIRTFAKDLKLAQNFEVVLDTQLLLNEAIDNLLEKVGRDDILTKVLMDFALEKINDDKSWDVSFDLNKIGKLLFNETNTKHLKLLQDKEINDFLELKKIIGTKIKTIETNTKELAINVLELLKEYGVDFKDFKRETLPNHFKKIAGGEFALSKLYKNKLLEDLSENKVLKAGVQLPSENLITVILEKYLSVKKKLTERSFLKNVLNQIIPLAVLNAIQKEVQAIQIEKGQLSISEFNTIISNEIKNQPAPFIYERLGEKYRHYFIDEFQDTSELQWNNLVPLIGNALESEDQQGNSGTLFLVGDAKQAIYRWRGGKAEQFLSLINKKANPFVIPPETYDLPSNYRSHEEIIKFNNDFFTSTSPFLNNELYNQLFKSGNQQEYTKKKGGYVQLKFIENEDKNDLEHHYCDEVFNTIKTLLDNGHGLNDIAVLVRDNKHGVLLADYLSSKEIPVISPDSLLICNDEKVTFLINLLKLSIDRNDLESAFNILYFLSKDKNDPHNFIHSNLKNLKGLLIKEYDFDINKLMQNSVFDGLEIAIKQFDLIKKSNAYLTFLMDVVYDVEQKEGSGIHAFLLNWQKKKDTYSIAAPSSMDAIQIMSIHKSKGLEFPIVIFPFANSHIYKEIDAKLWLKVNKSNFNGFNEVLINKKSEVVNYGIEAAEVYNEEEHKIELDAFNILYVALTRAEKALYIVTQKDLSSKGMEKLDYYSGLFIHFLKEKNLWEETQSIYSFGLEESNKNVHFDGTEEHIIPFQYSNKESPAFELMTKAGLLWDTDLEEALSKGTMFHKIMSEIETKDDIELVFEDLIFKGSINEKEALQLKEKVCQVVDHPKIGKYFSKGTTIKNEIDIVTKNGEILRPDRVVLKNNDATIIDYKTGLPNTKHHTQLNCYAQALEHMDYKIENKIIIYINKELNIEFI